MASYVNKIILGVLFILMPLGLAFDVNLIKSLTDGFHEGEYIGNLLNLEIYYSGMSSFPLLIHGAMDYVPSLLANKIVGENHLLVWTRFLNVAAVALCWLLYLDISRVILRRQSEKVLWGFLFYFTFLWMAIASGTDPVSKQQAFLGTRDLFLILSLWGGAKAFSCDSGVRAYLYLVVAGFFAGLSLYWSYDRGVISAIWILICALTLFFQRRSLAALATLLAYVTAVLLVSQMRFFGSLIDNYNNIVYWVLNTSDVWFLAFKMKLTALPGAFAMLIFSLAVILHAIVRIIYSTVIEKLPLVLGVIVVQLIFLSKMYSLPGFPTTYYFIWPSFLLLVLVPPKAKIAIEIDKCITQMIDQIRSAFKVLNLQDKLILGGAGVLVLILSSNSLVSGFGKIIQLIHPLPDEAMVDRNQFGVDILSKLGTGCVFLWSNEGVFTRLFNKPYCTKFPYAVYISKGEEVDALIYLKSNPPGVIVYDSPFWSMSIYGRHMRDRLPAIDRFIRENYVFHSSGTGYVFATPKARQVSN
ncbi:hypothetical protein HBO07_10745 [Pseudomonas proteolytica]|uniref:hypothetical protein n=1 Tax=Pseudomonas proteolytica TaxID=219574 RepID=UPI0014751D2D|nr:hypothetical protein [Pseudomonas proteolytica]NMZ11757.1 hypothetical protein [Pseudomonas proteolytica]